MAVTNTIFFYWILYALSYTRKTLIDRQQVVKYRIMRIFTVILAIAYIIGTVDVFAEIYLKFSGERDKVWRKEWIMEASWYGIFSVFLFAIMILMRPTNRSKMLAMVEELRESDTRDDMKEGNRVVEFASDLAGTGAGMARKESIKRKAKDGDKDRLEIN